MKKVERNELLSLSDYETIRPHFRGRMIGVKARRRVLLGPHMSLVFENHDTVLLQVQEMLRTERITGEKEIAHELETYNDLIPPRTGLCATLFIEYDDPAERTKMLGRFASLREAIQITVDGKAYVAKFSTHFGEEMDRLPAVNYLTFVVGPDTGAQMLDSSIPISLEVTHPDYQVQAPATSELREELSNDLSS